MKNKIISILSSMIFTLVCIVNIIPNNSINVFAVDEYIIKVEKWATNYYIDGVAYPATCIAKIGSSGIIQFNMYNAYDWTDDELDELAEYDKYGDAHIKIVIHSFPVQEKSQYYYLHNEGHVKVSKNQISQRIDSVYDVYDVSLLDNTFSDTYLSTYPEYWFAQNNSGVSGPADYFYHTGVFSIYEKNQCDEQNCVKVCCSAENDIFTGYVGLLNGSSCGYIKGVTETWNILKQGILHYVTNEQIDKYIDAVYNSPLPFSSFYSPNIGPGMCLMYFGLNTYDITSNPIPISDYTFRLFGHDIEITSEMMSIFASNNKSPSYTFISTKNIGDVNLDNKITAIDASKILIMCADINNNSIEPTTGQLYLYDVNRNGKIEPKDASIILMYCADTSDNDDITLSDYVLKKFNINY